MGMERGLLSLVSTIEELLGINNRGSGIETENTFVGICHADHKFGTNFADKRRRSAGIVHSRIQATERFTSSAAID
jgi:hypothetical protein